MPSAAGPTTANAVMGAVHAAEVVTILSAGHDFWLPVYGSFLRAPPGSAGAWGPAELLFRVNVRAAVCLFLSLAAADHLSVATWYRARYQSDIKRRVFPLRWLEYAFSATVMMWVILLFAGQGDLGALLAVSGLNGGMIACGWAMERLNKNTRAASSVQWWPFYLGSFLGLWPWVLVFYGLGGSNAVGEGPPAFVYGIVFSMAVLFFSFALVQWWQFSPRGREGYDPVARATVARTGYYYLSFFSKSVLAWVVYGQTLALGD